MRITRKRLLAPALAVAALLLLLIGMAASAGASTLAWQCGRAVCAIDPDVAGAQPRQLTPDGRFAGVTRDGATAAWVDANGALVQAPTGGGPPVLVWNGGTVSNQPSMSPDGQRFLWWYVGPDPFGGLGSVYISRYTVGAAGSEGISNCVYCTTSHGWVGTTPVAAFPGQTSSTSSVPSRICRLATTAEAPDKPGSCVQVLVGDPRGALAFPSGSPDGSELVASLAESRADVFEGRIVRYSLATGAPIADVTQGARDSTPTYSGDGTQIAFDRDGQIVVHELAGGAERVIGAGFHPSWGGARTVPAPSPGPGGGRGRGGPAPAPSPGRGGGRARAPRVLALAGTATPRGLATGRLATRVRCAAGCRVKLELVVSRATARALGLGSARVLASASGRRARSGLLVLKPRLASAPRGLAAAVGARRALPLTVRATVWPAPGAGGRARTATVAVTLRRG